MSVRLGAVLATMAACAVSGAAVAAERDDRVVEELNIARTTPHVYAERLRLYRSWFAGRVVTVPGTPSPVLTQEGVAAVDEAIRFLERQKPLPPLRLDSTLASAAKDWAAMQGPRGKTGHFAVNGTGPGERVLARGGDKYVAENIAYGSAEADLVVLQLIVDDGVRDRGHRKTVFDGAYAYAGAACGGHAAYVAMCVVEYSAHPRGTWPASNPRVASSR